MYFWSANGAWRLISAPRGNGLNLTFSHFELEPHHRRFANCSYDYLAVAEGELANITAGVRYCGNNMPTRLSTTASAITLAFASDNSVADNGFRVEWIVNGCGGQLTKPSASFRQKLGQSYICIQYMFLDKIQGLFFISLHFQWFGRLFELTDFELKLFYFYCIFFLVFVNVKKL